MGSWLDCLLAAGRVLQGAYREGRSLNVTLERFATGCWRGAMARSSLNSDGSWNEEKGIGGYAVAAVLVLAGAQSIFGFWGEQTHGAADTPWTSSTAPVLHDDEQVALATSLLWVLQSRAFLEVTKYVLHYDCLSAGKAITGEWRPLNDLGSRSHHGTPDKNGRDFTGVADQCHLWLPATLHDGTDVTYRQANGAGHRIDYIALGGLATVASLRSWVDVSFDTLAPNEDHDPVVLNSVWMATLTGRHIDAAFSARSMMAKGSCRRKDGALWARRCGTNSPLPWMSHPADHYEHLRQYVHGCSKITSVWTRTRQGLTTSPALH